ncbi:UNVERIFIED_CONTAM: hypothetical protein Sindi_1618700 [Sesamum indicum]
MEFKIHDVTMQSALIHYSNSLVFSSGFSPFAFMKHVFILVPRSSLIDLLQDKKLDPSSKVVTRLKPGLSLCYNFKISGSSAVLGAVCGSCNQERWEFNFLFDKIRDRQG